MLCENLCHLTHIQISRFYFEIEKWMVQFVFMNRNTFLCHRSRLSFGCPGRRRSTSSPTSAGRSTSWRTRTGRTGKSTSSTRSCPGEIACLFVCLLRGQLSVITILVLDLLDSKGSCSVWSPVVLQCGEPRSRLDASL